MKTLKQLNPNDQNIVIRAKAAATITLGTPVKLAVNATYYGYAMVEQIPYQRARTAQEAPQADLVAALAAAPLALEFEALPLPFLASLAIGACLDLFLEGRC